MHSTLRYLPDCFTDEKNAVHLRNLVSSVINLFSILAILHCAIQNTNMQRCLLFCHSERREESLSRLVNHDLGRDPSAFNRLHIVPDTAGEAFPMFLREDDLAIRVVICNDTTAPKENL